MLPQFDYVFHNPSSSQTVKDVYDGTEKIAKPGSSNPLAFLDQQTAGKSTNRDSDHHDGRPTQPAKQQVPRPLLGGGEDSSPLPSVDTSDAGAFVMLHGLQGRVRFSTTDRDSFFDAVVRLMGPIRNIDVAFLRLDHGSTSLVVDQIVHEIVNDSVIDPYGFDKIVFYLKMFKDRQEPSASTHVPFIYTPGDTLPKHHWDPRLNREFLKETAHGDELVYCVAKGDSDPGCKDTGYLHVSARSPSDQHRVAANHYREPMMVVARILTSGAGLAVLKRGDAGIIAHCRFGLHGHSPKFSSLGGMGLSQAQWDTIVKQAGETVEFDVEPVKNHAVGIFLAGLNSSGQLNKAAESETIDTSPPTSFRKGLARRIDDVLTSTTTRDEQQLMTGVMIWPNGQFWNLDERPVRASVAPCTVQSLEGLDDHPEVAPSVVAIRPVYSSYTANVVGDPEKSFSFSIDGQIDTFLDDVYAATLQTDKRPPIWVRQHKVGDPGTRPEFLLTANTAQHEWLAICSQIVSPEIWVQPCHAIDSADISTNGSAAPAWGFQPRYHNFQTTDFHRAFYLETVFQRNQKQSALAKNGAGKNKEDAVGERVESAATDEVELVTENVVETVNDTGKTSPTEACTTLDVCTLCAVTFTDGSSATDKLRHMADAHGVVHEQLRSARPGVIVEEAPGTERQPAPPPPKTRPKRKNGMPHESNGDAVDSLGDSGSGPATSSSRAAAKKRKIRTRAEDDPTYRPGDDSEDERDHDLGSAKFLAEDLLDEEQPKRRRAAAKKRVDDPTYRPSKDNEDDEDNSQVLAPRRAKRGRSADPSYQPGKEEDKVKGDETERLPVPKKAKRGGSADPSPQDGDQGAPDANGKLAVPKKTKRGGSADPSYRPTKEGEDDNGLPKDSDKPAVSRKTKPGGLEDPSYRPNGASSENADLDEQDEALRLSAVPEYGRDPTDPAGKRIRIIRETRATSSEPLAGEAKKTKGKRSRAGTPSKGGGSAAVTPRRGRSRATTPAVE